MRRRTKPRVVWLPQTNRNSIGPDFDRVFQQSFLTVGGVTGNTTVAEIPLVTDSQFSAVLDAASLADIESSGYRLRRIVGNVWATVGQSDPSLFGGLGAVTPISVILTAGIMVRKADTLTGDSLAAFRGPTAFDPVNIENTGDPWVWRRSWMLGNRWARGNYLNVSGNITEIQGVSPNNWAGYGAGVADGSHIDQKTARIVGPEERLFLDLSATVLTESVGGVDDQTVGCLFVTDLRILGSLRTNSGNRRNASR